MGSDDWYRNRDWDDGTAAAFETKLARARDKAQYLRIQGSTLKDSHPRDAIGLLQRCADIGDEFHTAHAYLEMAHAHYVLGEGEAALQALERAIEQEQRQPIARTSAPYDYAMLVALARDEGRYARALTLLGVQGEAMFASMHFQADAARAIILDALGDAANAREAAARALQAESVRTGWIPGYPEVGVVPNTDSPLSREIRRILAGG
jgi:tetratricopeptide (TPR) repeat protein